MKIGLHFNVFLVTTLLSSCNLPAPWKNLKHLTFCSLIDIDLLFLVKICTLLITVA